MRMHNYSCHMHMWLMIATHMHTMERTLTQRNLAAAGSYVKFDCCFLKAAVWCCRDSLHNAEKSCHLSLLSELARLLLSQLDIRLAVLVSTGFFDFVYIQSGFWTYLVSRQSATRPLPSISPSISASWVSSLPLSRSTRLLPHVLSTFPRWERTATTALSPPTGVWPCIDAKLPLIRTV